MLKVFETSSIDSLCKSVGGSCQESKKSISKTFDVEEDKLPTIRPMKVNDSTSGALNE
jgi:hypothetical protein